MSQARDFADSFSAVSTGRRNMVINGAMQVAQRGTSATGVTSSSYNTCDRIRQGVGSIGTYTISQETDAPNGFSNSYKVLTTTADASPATGDFLFLEYKIEGQDLQHLKYGTSDASTTTLSFWVKSSQTGTGNVAIQHNDNTTKRYIRNYTINTADTWEYKTITIAGRTDGAIDNDNNSSIQIQMWLGSGDTFTGTDKTSDGWHTADNSARNEGGTLDINAAVNRYWQITGLQWEVGNSASPFEHRSYGEELALCRRYYYRFTATSTYPAFGLASAYQSSAVRTIFNYPVKMRVKPTYTLDGSWRAFDDGSHSVTSSTISTNESNDEAASLTFYCSGVTVGNCYIVSVNNDTDAYLELNAEL